MNSKNNTEIKKTGGKHSEEEKNKREEADKKLGQQSNSNAWNDEKDFDTDDDEFGLDLKQT